MSIAPSPISVVTTGICNSIAKLTQRFRTLRIDHAAARINQRPPCLAKHAQELFAVRVRQRVANQPVHAMPVASHRQAPRTMEGAAPVLHIFRNVDHHRTGPAGARDLERSTDRGFKPGGIRHQEDMFGDRAHDAGDRGFLKRVAAHGGRGHLAADHDDGNRIRHAVTYRSNRIGGTGSGGHDADTDLAAGPCITRCHEPCALLVRGYDQRHLLSRRTGLPLVVDENGIVGGQNRPAAVAENRVYTLIRQHLHDDIGTRHLLAGKGMSARRQRGVTVFHGCVSVDRARGVGSRSDGMLCASSPKGTCR